ncbi:MAG: hypothetical protein AB7W16_13630 [Candidatus Obscuribacterales bacterium]
MSDHNPSATQSVKFSDRLDPVESREDLPPHWLDSPIEEFIGAHNFGKEIEGASQPRLLIVSCIEFRFRPQIPNNFAYVIRSAGGRMSNLAGSEFALSYIFAKGVKHIAIVGHNDCGMTKVDQFKPALIEALIDQGWEKEKAGAFIEENAGRFAMDDEIESLRREFLRLRSLFNNVVIAPLFVSLASNRLHIPSWHAIYKSDNQ